jgi:hypothetical protein
VLVHEPVICAVGSETIALDVERRLEQLYDRLSLGFGDRSRRAVRTATSGSNPDELDVERPHQVRLDSRANLQSWRNRLTADEVAEIRAICADAAAPLYLERKWWEAAGQDAT